MLKYILLLITLSGALCSPPFWNSMAQASSTPPPTGPPSVLQDHEVSTEARPGAPSTIPEESPTIPPVPPILDHLAGIAAGLIHVPGSIVRDCAESCHCNPFLPECTSGQHGVHRGSREVHGSYYPVGLGYYGRPYYHGHQHYPYYPGYYHHRGYYYYPGSWGYHFRNSDGGDFEKGD